MSNFYEMNDHANKKLLDRVHRKHMQAMIDVANSEYKKGLTKCTPNEFGPSSFLDCVPFF